MTTLTIPSSSSITAPVWAEARRLLGAAQTVIVVTHVGPDGDAIGSLLGVTNALQALGKTIIAAVDGGVPRHLAFIPGSDQVRSTLADVTADLVISVDASDVPRTGEVGKYALALGVPVIMVDHHRTNLGFGMVNLLDMDTSSCAEVVLDWLDTLGLALTPDVAYCLLTGIVTDTLCFRVNSVTAHTLEKAGRLMQAGASLPDITQRTVNRRSTTALRLWAHVLPTLKIENGVIWAVADQKTLKKAHYVEEGGAGGLVQLLNEADETHIAAVFREKDDGAVELHLRAQPGFDVGSLALSLGGGGHTLASGATIPGPLADVVARVVPLLKQTVRDRLSALPQPTA
ncbi:MAG: DHH family phosphoesterase [Aggregatilineales bacterium]